jgi:hypothetical protein
VKAHAEVDQAAANPAYENQQLVVMETNEAPAKGSVGSAEAALLSVKFALADSALWAPIAGVLPIARCSSANTSPQAYA